MVNHTFLSIEHLCCGLVGIIIDRFSMSIGEVVIVETCTCELCVHYFLEVKTAMWEVLVVYIASALLKSPDPPFPHKILEPISGLGCLGLRTRLCSYHCYSLNRLDISSNGIYSSQKLSGLFVTIIWVSHHPPHAFIAPAFWPLSPLLKMHSYSLNSHLHASVLCSHKLYSVDCDK